MPNRTYEERKKERKKERRKEKERKKKGKKQRKYLLRLSLQTANPADAKSNIRRKKEKKKENILFIYLWKLRIQQMENRR